MKKISVLIPCYNEEENVVPISEAVIGIITKELPQYDYELVFIDNDSTDKTRELLRSARHPYSRALIRSIPGGGARGSRLETIPGSPPALFEPPASCMFAPRCPYADETCRTGYPAMADCGDGHLAACFKPLTEETLQGIAALMLDEYKPGMEAKGIAYSYTPAALKALVQKSQGGRFGARDLRRTIRKAVEDPAAERLIDGTLASGGTLVVDADENGEIILK